MNEKLVLDNGVRILYERVPGVRSVSMGVWVASGSRLEKAAQSGASHYIEHMLFKGTGTRTAAQLAEEMDEIGGQINAFTTKECTCFHGRVLDTHLGRFTDMLCDMFFNSTFSEDLMDSERGIIFEEIDMYKDTPDDLCAEKLAAGIFKGSGLARPILGRRRSLNAMTGQWLRNYKDEHYTGQNVAVALAGSFTDGDLQKICEAFSVLPRGKKARTPKGAYTPAMVTARKSIEQNHLIMGFPGIPSDDDRRFALQILNGILGGGMSSRLFQTLREKHGLCYSVYSYPSSYTGTGAFSVYTALSPETEKKAIGEIKLELCKLAESGVTTAELDRSREQIKASLLMALESTASRMNRLGAGELSVGKVIPVDEVVQRYDDVTVDDVLDLARRIFDFSKVSVSVVGRCAPAAEYMSLAAL